MQTEFEKSIRAVRSKLKKTTDNKQKLQLREELKQLKEIIQKEKMSS
jgi:hypothetical protein